ncbi:glycosyltransferase family 4 protein [Planctomicrobium sp. SH668]|uniref:glycosyltransferase family 4 protein n=1 Tax=Planctomicrobium sp. SH668 TaxID=3448126 RepID=UPI003F5C1ACA
MQRRDWASLAERALALATQGDLLSSREIYRHLAICGPSRNDSRLAHHNLACVEAALGGISHATTCLNDMIGDDFLSSVDRNLQTLSLAVASAGNVDKSQHKNARRTPLKIAILSLLFNWPSTGGGTVHTKDLAYFLTNAGYQVRHLYAAYEPWSIGVVNEPLGYHSESIDFQPMEWTPEMIRERFRDALQRDPPDWVVVTDSWNAKPLLIEAAKEFRTFVRIAAQESICPLNNVRLQIDTAGQVSQCDGNQFVAPDRCRTCVSCCGEQLSGALHQAERELCDFGTDESQDRFQRAYANVEGVLVINPQIADLVRPSVRKVHVIPSGFDAERFPEPEPVPSVENRPVRFLFAGLVPEFMKGFHVLREAGRLLWSQRQDFEIWATGDEDGSDDPWVRFVGWQSQEQLPRLISQCDVLVFPTIAQEALGRTAVEAMGCGRPVIGSRIGGLQWVIDEGKTGLLCEPGDAFELATQIAKLLNEPALRAQMGTAGRQKFLREFTWDEVIRKHYLPLLGAPV